MSVKQAGQAKKSKFNPLEKNPIETIADLGTSSLRQTAQELGGIAGGVFDQFMGKMTTTTMSTILQNTNSTKQNLRKEESKPVFRFHEHHENHTVKQEIAEIQQLIEQVKQEIKMIKQQNQAMLAEVKDVEKLTLGSSQESSKPYDSSFWR